MGEGHRDAVSALVSVYRICTSQQGVRVCRLPSEARTGAKRGVTEAAGQSAIAACVDGAWHGTGIRRYAMPLGVHSNSATLAYHIA